MGKGRTIAGLILENWLRGRRRHFWFSVSNDLYVDAQRDLTDVGAGHIPHVSLNTLSYDDPRLDTFEGIVFVTYTTSVGRTRFDEGQTRVEQLVRWANRWGKEEFNGVMVFDEGREGRMEGFLGQGVRDKVVRGGRAGKGR